MLFGKYPTPCLIKTKIKWYVLATHSSIFRAGVTKERQLLGHLLQVSFWQEQSSQRLHLSAWKFPLLEGRGNTEENTASEFSSVKTELGGNVEVARGPGKSVYVVSGPSQTSRSSSFRLYVCYFSLQYVMYILVCPHKDWDPRGPGPHRVIFVSSGVRSTTFQCKKNNQVCAESGM